MMICLVLILFVTLALFIFIKTFDTTHFKDQLSNQLSVQLDRKVSIDKLDLSFSFFRGLFLSVHDLQIVDDRAFSAENLFSVGEVKLDIDILAFLIQKKVVVGSISVDSPRISVVRDSKGVLNIQKPGAHPIEALPLEKEKTTETPKPSRSLSSPKKETPRFPQLLVRAIRIDKGQLNFADHTQNPPIALELKNITLSIVGLSSNTPFKFTLGASMLSEEEQNIEVKGQGQLDLKTLQIRLDNVKVGVDLDQIAIKKLEQAVPSLKAAEWGLSLKGKMETTVSQMVMGAEGLLLLAATGTVSKTQFNLPNIPLSITGGMDYEISEKDVQISHIAFMINQGSLSGQVRLDDYLKEQKYFMNLETKNIDLMKSLPELGPQVNFQGKLNGFFKLNGKGFRPDKLREALGGEGQIDIAQGVVNNFNILKFILSKMTILPKLDEVLLNNLPEKYKEQLEQKGTVFDNISIKTSFKKGDIMVDRAELVSLAFSLVAQGRIDRSQNMDFKASLYVAKELADQMVSLVPELKVLVEEDGRLSIPVKTYGFRIFPDTEVLAKKLILREGKEQFQGLLDKVLGGKAANPAPGQPTDPSPSGEEPSPEETITNILDSILK